MKGCCNNNDTIVEVCRMVKPVTILRIHVICILFSFNMYCGLNCHCCLNSGLGPRCTPDVGPNMGGAPPLYSCFGPDGWGPTQGLLQLQAWVCL